MISVAWLALAVLCLAHLLPPLPEFPAGPELLACTLALLACLGGVRLLGIALPLAGLLVFVSGFHGRALSPQLDGHTVLLQGEVCDLVRGNQAVWRFRFEHSGENGLPERLYLSWQDAPAKPQAGERWQLRLRLKRPRGLRNPGAFDFERWALLNGIGGSGFVVESGLNRRMPATTSGCRLTKWRGRLTGRITALLDGHEATGFVLGLAAGARQQLSARDWDVLRRTGTNHLMAISGLHIGLVAGFCLMFGRLVGRILLACDVHVSPRLIGQFAATVAALGYSALSGFGLPTIRALAMILPVLAAFSLRRLTSAWEIFAFALYIVLLVDATATFSSGFWLSYGAVAVILLGAHACRSGFTCGPRGKLRRYAGLLFFMQCRLTAGLAPISAILFQQLTGLGAFANLVAVPVFSFLIVPLTLIGTLVLMLETAVPNTLAPPGGLATVLLRFAADSTGLAISGLEWLSDTFDLVWIPPGISVAAAAAAFAGVLLLLWPRPLPGRLLAVALLLPAATGTLFDRLPPEAFRVVVMDVGHGLAVLIRTRRHTLLYDAGPAFRQSDAGRSVVIPVLRAAGVSQLDALLISHSDRDHRGGAATVLNAFPAAQLIGTTDFDLAARRFRSCKKGEQWTWDGVRFEILHPGPSARRRPWSDNDSSCILRVESQWASVLLPGDIETAAEAALLGRGQLAPVDLVVAPHHGSASSSSQALVDALRPRFVVFSVAAANRWRLPRRSVSKRWAQAGACLLTTGETGALTFDALPAKDLRLVRAHRLDNLSLTDGSGAVRSQCAI